jgi:hypothetical protein
MFVVYCIVWILCVVNLRMANRNVRLNLSSTVLVSVVVLFFLGEPSILRSAHSGTGTGTQSKAAHLHGGRWLLGQSSLDSWCGLEPAQRRGYSFIFQIVDPDPALPVGPDPRPEPDPNRIMMGEKGWIKIRIRTPVNPDPHPGLFYRVFRSRIRAIKCYHMALFGLFCCKLKNFLIDHFLRLRP